MMVRTLVFVLLFVAVCYAKDLSKDLPQWMNRSLGNGTDKIGMKASSAATTRTPTRATSRYPPAPTTRPPTRAPTTTLPYIYCYSCGYSGRPCPDPFPRFGSGVSTELTYTKWCIKVGPTDQGTGPTSRRAAQPGECYSNTCRRTSPSTESCCCNRDYCNDGIISSKSTPALIISILTLLCFFGRF